MLQSTRAIVIHSFPYSDSSLIIKAYTEQDGYSSFLLKGFKKNRKQKILIHPLGLVEISYVKKANQSLRFARSVNLENPFAELLVDPVKSGVAMFLSEWLGHTIKEDEEGDHIFFSWLVNAIETLNQSDKIANFHIWFLLKLSDFMGFAPQGKRTARAPFFNLQEGIFSSMSTANEVLNDKDSILMDRVLNRNLELISELSLSKEDRFQLLQLLQMYFQLHLGKEITLKSLDVLVQLFDD